MALLPILRFPDSRLHRIAETVTHFDPSLTRLATDMAETMYQAKGIGLAATQVNVHRRVIVVDVSESKDDCLTLINPEIIETHSIQTCEEGCLSVPGIFEKVSRAESICVSYTSLKGENQELRADALLAACIQHEIDHLNGKVFIQYLSQLKQSRIRSKMIRTARETL